MCRPFIAAVAVLVSSTALAEEIALKSIYARNIPGTIALDEGIREDSRSTEQGILVGEINQSLRYLPDGKKPRSAFAVVGTGDKALKEAHAVLFGKGPPKQTLPADSNLSVVFFSYEVGSYVHLVKAFRNKNDISVQYLFVPHETKEMTHHFALIPIGCFKKLSGNVEPVFSDAN